MIRFLGMLGSLASLYAIAWLLFDGFGDDLGSLDVARFGVAAIAGALLANATRRGGRPPWARGHHGAPWGDRPLTGDQIADIAKHAIDADAKVKASD